MGVAWVFALLGVVGAYDEFRARIPNGQRMDALGHVNPVGGGERNVFGLDFAMFGLEWTLEMCASDSDMDGQHNGFELGDECCCWEATTAWALQQAPYFPPDGSEPHTGHLKGYGKHHVEELPRSDLLSNPADPTSTSGAPRKVRGQGEGCEAMCERVKRGAAAALEASAAEKARRSGVVPFDVATVPMVNLVSGLSLGVALCVAAFLPALGARQHVGELGVAGLFKMFLVSAVYMDMTGLLLHLVLDNKGNEGYALLAGGVRSFINHHADPQKIAATPALHYASARRAAMQLQFQHECSRRTRSRALRETIARPTTPSGN